MVGDSGEADEKWTSGW